MPRLSRPPMERIHGGDLKPERTLRGLLLDAGLELLLHPRHLPGTPDVVVPTARLVVFVDGCFWHGCPDHFRVPKSNADGWTDHVRRNKERDRRNESDLARLGWTVMRVWEHDLTSAVRARAAAAVVLAEVRRLTSGGAVDLCRSGDRQEQLGLL